MGFLKLRSSGDVEFVYVRVEEVFTVLELKPEHGHGREQITNSIVMMYNGMAFPVKDKADKIMEELWGT